MTSKMVGKIFRHFKGAIYIVEDIAKDANLNEEVVVYRALYEDNQLYIRPLSEWDSFVGDREDNVTGQENRFQCVELSKNVEFQYRD